MFRAVRILSWSITTAPPFGGAAPPRKADAGTQVGTGTVEWYGAGVTTDAPILQ
jgi:hypothetical protein